MSSPTYDLNFLRAGLQELKPYLLSTELFWPLDLSAPAGQPPYPKLTLGNLLLSLARLQAWPLDPQSQAEFTRLQAQLQLHRTQWRTAWEAKAGREFSSRLRQWSHTVNEFIQDPPNHAGAYPYQVRVRYLIERLSQELSSFSPDELEFLANLDHRLRTVFVPGAFAWQDELAASFDASLYWYLFGGLTSTIG